MAGKGAAPEAGAEEKKSGGLKNLSKFFSLGFIVLNLLVTGGGLGLVYMSTIAFEKQDITEESAKEEIEKEKAAGESSAVVYTMDPFIVNLDGRPRRTMKAVVSVEMLDERGFEEVVGLGADARDAIVSLLGSKTFSDLESVQGKLFLKDEIANRINSRLKEGVVKDIYFSELVVQ